MIKMTKKKKIPVFVLLKSNQLITLGKLYPEKNREK